MFKATEMGEPGTQDFWYYTWQVPDTLRSILPIHLCFKLNLSELAEMLHRFLLRNCWEESSDSFSLSVHCDSLQRMWPLPAHTSRKFVLFFTYARTMPGRRRIASCQRRAFICSSLKSLALNFQANLQLEAKEKSSRGKCVKDGANQRSGSCFRYSP